MGTPRIVWPDHHLTTVLKASQKQKYASRVKTAELGYTGAMSSLTPTRYQHSVVRHLAWLLSAPPLWHGAWRWALSPQQRAHLGAVLDHWEAEPESGPAFLTAPAARRLGQYFEQLYECLMTELLGWEK
jgi:hypothetical protein